MDSVKPAQLSFLAIYNPSLGQSDESLHDQVVYYYPSKGSRGRKDAQRKGGKLNQEEHEEKNERLRQIGLAQGMVELAKAFSEHDTVDSIDAEKSRILLYEIESGWWILASVELTRIEIAPKKSKGQSEEQPTFEYSSREVAPHGLLLQQLLRAHYIFLSHHGYSLSEILERLSRQSFCAALERFWNRFVRGWDVLLHGSPAVDIFNGVKIATGGELGIGVGEEEWGSGEREVLEGFISRTDGLVDVIVSRFGDSANPVKDAREETSNKASWLGRGRPPRSIDGVIFSGIGNLTRRSVRDVSAWMEWIYQNGQSAYGVVDSPHSARQKRMRRQNVSVDQTVSPPSRIQDDMKQSQPAKASTGANDNVPASIPPPIVRAADSSLQIATMKAENTEASQNTRKRHGDAPSGTDTFVKYMTLGFYGSEWGIPSGRPRSHSHPAEARKGPNDLETGEKTESDAKEDTSSESHIDVENGCFLIGLQGDLDKESMTDEEGGTETGAEEAESNNWNQRIMLRSLYLKRNRSQKDRDDNQHEKFLPLTRTYDDRLRVVVYVRRPFIFTFFFEMQTPTLSYSGLYRSLHHQLGPLQRPLLHSTSPSTAAARHTATLASPRTTSAPSQSTPSGSISSPNPIFDLVFDPLAMTIHSSLPGIPDIEELLTLQSSSNNNTSIGDNSSTEWRGDSSFWKRADALNVHSQILSTWEATRRRRGERERTAKTSRGWWIVWMRLQVNKDKDKDKNYSERGNNDAGSEDGAQVQPTYREAFLVRKASDYAPSKASSSTSSGFGFGFGGGSGTPAPTSGSGGGGAGTGNESAWGSAGKLAEGIGIDARRYVEGLFNLNR